MRHPLILLVSIDSFESLHPAQRALISVTQKKTVAPAAGHDAFVVIENEVKNLFKCEEVRFFGRCPQNDTMRTTGMRCE